MSVKTRKRMPRSKTAKKNAQPLPLWIWLALFGLAVGRLHGQVVLNEILFNPPGNDLPNEYIELRGTPNYVLPSGTYLVAVEGDAENNPGAIENVFDLSGRAIGGNGFLVLLQKTNFYAPNPAATILANTNNGGGWGSGGSSSIGHRGESGRTDLLNPSVTFFLIQSPAPPSPGADLDLVNSGVLGGVATNWTILDSVGVLDNTGAGDFAYGAINYRRNGAPGSGAGASGVIVPVDFTASYLGRAGHTTGSGALDWVACNNLKGAVPNWSLDDIANTMPGSYAGKALNHLGAPNFGANALDGVVAIHPEGAAILEGSTDSYTLALNTKPQGRVTIQAAAAAPLQISADNGATFGAAATLILSNTTPRTVLVRALEDNVLDSSPRLVPISDTILSTEDPSHYPTTALAPIVTIAVLEKDGLLLNEVKVNPPGPEDGPYEFIELWGRPGVWLDHVYLLALDGQAGGNPGKTLWVADLSDTRLGSAGLVAVLADGHPYSVPAGAAVYLDSALGDSAGALGNSSLSLLLVSSPRAVRPDTDLDDGNNGILEGLPDGTTVLDAVGWRANTNDLVYGGVSLTDGPGTPDAAARFPTNHIPRSAAAWFYGELAGTDGTSLVFDTNQVSANFPMDFPLTPGQVNHAAPILRGLAPLAGAIGDPTNPKVNFTVSDLQSNPGALTGWAVSGNQAVVPDSHLRLEIGPSGAATLSLDPVGVGYALITIYVNNGTGIGQGSFLYAASERNSPGTRYHAGASDASAALPIDANYMFVGDDENQTVRVYHRNQSGAPLAQFEFTSFLALPDLNDGLPREVDIEACTRVGNRIFWMGSHAHNLERESRTNRARLFATDVAGAGAASTLAYAGRYDFLKLDLVNWDQRNVHGKGSNYYGLAVSTTEGINSKGPEGFNIEGLTMAPDSTSTAYLGFRAPQVPPTNRTFALIVPVLNFASLAAGTGPPGSAVFGSPIELDLYGRGIRSIEGRGANFLIVAGPPGVDFPSDPHPFRLYTWTGNPADPPQMRAADLTGLNPEAIVELPPAPWTSETQVQLLSDNGIKVWYDDDIQAKHLSEPAFKKNRSDWVALGPVIQPSPVVTVIQYSGNSVALQWRALKGLRYRVQYKSTLSQPNWTDLPGDVLATGPYASKTDSNPLAGQRFYQVVVNP